LKGNRFDVLTIKNKLLTIKAEKLFREANHLIESHAYKSRKFWSPPKPATTKTHTLPLNYGEINITATLVV
jgi:hypothetical protein